MVSIGNGFSHGALRWLPVCPTKVTLMHSLAQSSDAGNASKEKTSNEPLSGVGADV